MAEIAKPILDAKMATDIKGVLVKSTIPFEAWQRAGEIDVALSDIINGRAKVVPVEA